MRRKRKKKTKKKKKKVLLAYERCDFVHVQRIVRVYVLSPVVSAFVITAGQGERNRIDLYYRVWLRLERGEKAAHRIVVECDSLTHKTMPARECNSHTDGKHKE